MHASVVLAVFAAAAAALPQGISQSSPSSPRPSSSSSAGGSGGSCNLIQCVEALGPAGGKCVDFAFGGSGKNCVQGVLDNIEHMPPPCADCLNALFLGP